jgi:hypothetical protein
MARSAATRRRCGAAKEQGIFRKYGWTSIWFLSSTEGVVAMLKLMTQHGLNPKAAQVKPNDITDMSYCKKFEDSEFCRSLYQ